MAPFHRLESLNLIEGERVSWAVSFIPFCFPTADAMKLSSSSSCAGCHSSSGDRLYPGTWNTVNLLFLKLLCLLFCCNKVKSNYQPCCVADRGKKNSSLTSWSKDSKLGLVKLSLSSGYFQSMGEELLTGARTPQRQLRHQKIQSSVVNTDTAFWLQ